VPCVHTVSQAPQLELSFCSSTQAVPHVTMPAAQLHTPPTQGTALAQVVPQEPQLFGSLVSLTHAPPQLERFGAHCS